MKKLTAVMAAAMALTIGGVYATWNYSESGKVAYENSTKQLSVNVTDPVISGAEATVSISNYSTQLKIDGETREVGGVQKANVAKLVPDGQLTLTVALSDTAENVKSVEVTFTLVIKAHAVYPPITNQHVFTSTHIPYTVVVAFDDSVQTYDYVDDNDDGIVSADITMSQIVTETGFGLNGDIVLPLKSDYDTFVDAVGTAIIDLTVTAEIKE